MAVDAYQELGGVLVGYLRANLRCDEDAQDLAQEVYLRIARHPNIGEIQSIKAFVFMQRFEAIVAGLRPACRQAYILNRIYSLSYAGIADYMQISVSMVEKHISAALRALRADCQVH